MNVVDLMTTNLFTLGEGDTLKTAKRAMAKHRIRHVPIVDKDHHLLGLLTQRDILSTTVSSLAELDSSEQDELDTNIPIREIMVRNPVAVDAKTSLHDAAKLLLEKKFGCLPVVAGEHLIGIVTEVDFLKLVVELLERCEELLEECSFH